MKRQQVGRWGEQLAADYLSRQGYEILARNLRTPYGEIDLVAMQNGTVVFVEVKARTGEGFGMPEESITGAKRTHLLKAIQHYWQSRGDETAWRVDVIAIIGRPGHTEPQLEHFENALTE